MARNAVFTALMSIVFWWVDCSTEVVMEVYFTQVLLKERERSTFHKEEQNKVFKV